MRRAATSVARKADVAADRFRFRASALSRDLIVDDPMLCRDGPAGPSARRAHGRRRDRAIRGCRNGDSDRGDCDDMEIGRKYSRPLPCFGAFVPVGDRCLLVGESRLTAGGSPLDRHRDDWVCQLGLHQRSAETCVAEPVDPAAGIRQPVATRSATARDADRPAGAEGSRSRTLMRSCGRRLRFWCSRKRESSVRSPSAVLR